MTLTEFYAARLDEDEAMARSAGAGSWSATGGDLYDGTDPHTRNGIGETWEWERDYGEGLAAAAHIVRHDPARVLREVEAGRKILDLHHPTPGLRHPVTDNHVDICSECAAPELLREEWERVGNSLYPCRTARLLAAVWSNHPDYDEAWRP